MQAIRQLLGPRADQIIFVGVASNTDVAWLLIDDDNIVDWSGWFSRPDVALVDLRDVAPLDWVLVAGSQLRPFLRAVGLHDDDPIPHITASPRRDITAVERAVLAESVPVTYLVMGRCR